VPPARPPIARRPTAGNSLFPYLIPNLQEIAMHRRELFSAAGAVVVAAAVTPAFAADGQGAAEHGDHSAHGAHDHGTGAGLNGTLVAAATHCTHTGLACINHCLDSFAAGDTAMARCARTVDQMLSVCGTLAKLASTGSPHLAAMAKVALAVCLECEQECRKHADQHAVCKACAEACAACAVECRKVAA